MIKREIKVDTPVSIGIFTESVVKEKETKRLTRRDTKELQTSAAGSESALVNLVQRFA